MLALLWLAICPGNAADDRRTVRIGLVPFEPLCAQHQKQYTRFLHALFDTIAEQEHWRPVYRSTSCEKGQRLLSSGQIDLLGPLPQNGTPDGMDFTREVFLATWAQIFTPAGNPIQSPLDLNGLAIGLLGSSHYSRQVRETLNRFDVTCRFVQFRNHGELADALSRRWIDAAAIDRLYGTLHADLATATQSGVIFAPLELRFAVAHRTAPELVKAVDFHLRQMKLAPDCCLQSSTWSDSWGKNQQPPYHAA